MNTDRVSVGLERVRAELDAWRGQRRKDGRAMMHRKTVRASWLNRTVPQFHKVYNERILVIRQTASGASFRPPAPPIHQTASGELANTCHRDLSTCPRSRNSAGHDISIWGLNTEH